MIKIYAPASIGNISVGFDVLGAAVSPINNTLLGDCVSICAAETFSLEVSGQFVSRLPADPKENIIFHCWQRFCQELGEDIAVRLCLEKNMPIGSGLGSSACSVVAGLVALNEYCQRPFNEIKLLTLMGELEGKISGGVHYDNVAPCFLGGIQLILEQPEMISQSVPGLKDWYWVMAYPGIKVSTAEARAILPEYYIRAQCIEHGRHVGTFVHACHTQQSQLAAKMMKDVIAEPYRMQLLPNFATTKETMYAMGALACGISGSGPTIFTITDDLTLAHQLALWLQQHYVQNDQGFVHICQLDMAGTRRLD